MRKKVIHIALFLFTFARLSGQDISVVSITSTPEGCNGDATGTVSVEVSGGNGNLTFALQQGIIVIQSSGEIADRNYTFTGVGAASYFVIVFDNDGTTNDASGVITVGTPDPITISNVSVKDET